MGLFEMTCAAPIAELSSMILDLPGILFRCGFESATG